MPLTAKGSELLANFQKEYGEKKGEEVFYAAKNKGTITGVDSADGGIVQPVIPATIKGAGILFLSADGKALFLKRSASGDHAGEWCFPGGKQEEGESLEECAARETQEEIGSLPKGKRELLCRSVSQNDVGSVDFSTYLQPIAKGDEGFPIELDAESVGVAWAPAAEPPEPLHPGCRVALKRLTANELDIARMMAAGELTSPQRYMNVTLWAMRITGTGASHRGEVKDEKTGKVLREAEHVWRKPENYLNDEFLARCNGLTVIWVHPEKATLNSKEFSDRVIGSIFLPYIKGDEVWGIAKVYDDDANKLMAENQLSTSPTVVLGDPKDPGMILRTEDGEKINVEGAAKLHDHLAVVPAGVWDKGGEPTGILNEAIGDSNVTEEEKMAAEDKARKDAAEKEEKEKADKARMDAAAKADEKLDKMLTGIGDMSKRVDAVCARMDAFESKGKGEEKDDARKDGESEKEHEERMDKKRKDAATADAKAKADAEEKEKEEKEKADKAKADAASSAEIANVRAEIEAMRASMKPRTPEERKAFADVQLRADSAYAAFGKQAPGPLDGETLRDYTRRLVSPLKVNSAGWKDVDLDGINDAAMTVAEGQIYADSIATARRAADVPFGKFREIVDRSQAGHTIITFQGQSSFVRKFTRARGNVSGMRMIEARKGAA